jgi:dTDP-glucose 4,6-dehydratase
MYNILITGGAGFIGSHLVDHFLKDDEIKNIVIVDSLLIGSNIHNIPVYFDEKASTYYPTNGKIVFEYIDLSATNDMWYLEKSVINKYRPRYIFHLAAQTHVDRSIESGVDFAQSNVLGTVNLLECLKEKSFIERVLIFSTDEVLGVRNEGQMYEGDPITPRNIYSATKASQEMIADGYRLTHGIPCVVSRCSNAYGPRQWPEKFLPTIIKGIINECKIPVYGSGNQVREWTYVEDVCLAVEKIIKNAAPGEVWHIGSNVEKTNLEIIEFVLSFFGRTADKYVKHVADRKGHDFRYSINCDRLRGVGWAPSTHFDVGMKSTISWYVKNSSILSKYV